MMSQVLAKNLKVTSQEALELMLQEDMASLPRIMLRRVKNPSGGSVFFTIKDESGEEASVGELNGVVVHHHPSNAYWIKGNKEEEDKLMCQSPDGTVGFGNPGGVCSKCSYNRFPKDGKGGKPCKNSHVLYLLANGEAMPMIVTVPPTSINEWSKFLSEVLGPHQKPTKTVEISIKLSKVKGQGNIAWAVFNFSVIRQLSEQEVLNAISKSQIIQVMIAQRKKELSMQPEDTSEDVEITDPAEEMIEVADQVINSMKKDPIGINVDKAVKTPRDAKRTVTQMVLQGCNLGNDNQKEREVILFNITGKSHTTDMNDQDLEKFINYVANIQGKNPGDPLDLSIEGLAPVSNHFFELIVGAIEVENG